MAIFDAWLFCLSLCSLCLCDESSHPPEQQPASKRRIHHKDTKGTKERKGPRWQFLMHGFSAFLCVLCAFVVNLHTRRSSSPRAKEEFTTKTQRAQRKEK